MNDSTFSSSSLDLDQFNQIFSQLAAQDIEQFQLLYQHWAMQQQINDVQQEIAATQQQLAATVEQIERIHPSAIALATLARLQASGVEDIDLLDRMLERGEEWLDHTIQHLEYCERLDVIRGDYEEWCRHALDDAFAWLDSLQSNTSIAAIHVADTVEPAPTSSNEDEAPGDEATEEIFLQKLMSEEAGSEDAIPMNADAKSEEISVPAATAIPTRMEQPAFESGEAEADILETAGEPPVLEESTLKVAAVHITAEVQDGSEDTLPAQDKVEDKTIDEGLATPVAGEAPLATPEPSNEVPVAPAETIPEATVIAPEPALETGAATPQPVGEKTSAVGNRVTGAQEESAGRRSNVLQRFLSALWP